MRWLIGATVASVVLGLGWWLLMSRPPPSDLPLAEVRVAAASDLKFALDELVKVYHEQRPNAQVRVTYGSSGNFFAQLVNRAPFDMYLSADLDYPRRLIERGLADKDSEFRYARGHLVVWVRKQLPLDVEGLGIKALLDPSVHKIAIANPTHAPYGRAAESALKSLDVYDQVKDKLVLGENVAQAAQFVQTGSAEVGVIGLSLAMAPAMRHEGRFWPVPLEASLTLEQGGVILSWARDRQAADDIRTFLLSGQARAILKQYGFEAPGE